jgi:hypothetical protein
VYSAAESPLLLSAASRPRTFATGTKSRKEEKMKFSDAVNKVIDLAGKISNYYETELPKKYPNYPIVDHDEENFPPPPETKELNEFLATLSEDTIYQLMLIAYLGRSELSVNNLAEEYEKLQKDWGTSGQEAFKMMNMASLAEELSDGLEELRKHKIPVDKMPLKKMKVRKR